MEDFPEDLEFDEYLAWGEEALFNADYLGAAEAFRRAMKLRDADDYPKFQLGLSLFGAEIYDLSALAIELGLDQNPSWLHRRFNLVDAFADAETFDGLVNLLERHLIRKETDQDARFVLAYTYFFSGNLFGARSVLKVPGRITCGLEASRRHGEGGGAPPRPRAAQDHPLKNAADHNREHDQTDRRP